jgi:hypothetical protein
MPDTARCCQMTVQSVADRAACMRVTLTEMLRNSGVSNWCLFRGLSTEGHQRFRGIYCLHLHGRNCTIRMPPTYETALSYNPEDLTDIAVKRNEYIYTSRTRPRVAVAQSG